VTELNKLAQGWHDYWVC